jgi:hypothetical protein
MILATHALTALTRGIALASIAGALAACATKPALRHDHDPSADFKSYKTFAFYDQASGSGPHHYTTLLSSRLQQATRAQMERHDYIYSEHDPDLRVNLQLKVVDRQELRSTHGGRGFYGYRGWSGGLETVEYRQGTLAVDLVDTHRNALVWRGLAEGRLDTKASEQPGPARDAAVAEIFSSFPDGKQK